MNESILKKGFIEFVEGGLDEENKSRFRLSITAYFKAISQLCDLMILKKTGFLPRNHTERFRILKEQNPETYNIVDLTFKVYRDTYSRTLTKETCVKIKNEIPKIIKIGNLEEEFKEIIRKIQEQNS